MINSSTEDHISRNRFLTRRLVLSGSALGLASLALSGCTFTRSSKESSSVPIVASDSASLTTLKARVVGGDKLNENRPYVRLALDGPQKLVLREELCTANPKRAKTRTTLAAFAHITDTHIMDPTSPVHTVLSLFRPGDHLADRSDFYYRPQDSLSVHVLDAMIRRLNSMKSGPIANRPFDFYISTGDASDRRASNEVLAFIETLNGEETSAFATPGTTTSMQSPITLPSNVARFIWQPLPSRTKTESRIWQEKYGFPNSSNLLSSASKLIKTEGANVPWYSGFGNHDTMIPQGPKGFGTPNQTYYSFISTGNKFPLNLPPDMDFSTFMKAIDYPTHSEISSIVNSMPGLKAIASNTRRAMSKTEFMSAHMINPGPHGPTGHGFTMDNIRSGKAYYTFQMPSGMLGIMLDTTDPTGGGAGSLDREQTAWLESELRRISAVRYDAQGQAIHANVSNKLVVLFSHHPSVTFHKEKSPEIDPRSINSEAKILDLLGRYPNIVLWVNGHMHSNHVWQHTSRHGDYGFWEVNTASHIDHPQQARSIEILDNNDGTLSVFGIMVNHSDPSVITYDNAFTRSELATFSSELAFNNPSSNTSARTGTDQDQNVELILKKPF